MASSRAGRTPIASSAPLMTAAAVVAVIAAVTAVGVHLARLGWGLDRTDEGQYLLLMADPSVSRSTVFLFGAVLQPLFTALGGDIHLLRIAGTLITVALTAALGALTARTAGADGRASALTAVVAGAFGVGPMLYFPLTPSYNTLAFWGVCVWAAGLVLTGCLDRECRTPQAGPPSPSGLESEGGDHAGSTPRSADARRAAARRLTGPVLLGVGGVVAFSGKATTGAALAALTLVVAVVLVWVRRRGRTRFCVALVVGAGLALLAFMALVGHGPVWLVDFYQEGARSVALLQGHDDLVRWDPFSADAFLSLPAVMAVLVFTSAMPLVSRRGRGAVVLPAVALGLTATALATALTGESSAPVDRPVMLLVWWWIPVLAVMAVFVAREQAGPLTHAAPVRLLVVAAMVVLPLAYVLGTNGNYWIAQSRAGVFWFLAGVVAVGPRAAQRRVFTACVAVFVLVVAVCSLAHGYRYDSPLSALTQATEVAQVSPEGAELRVTAADARTSRDLAALARSHHLDDVPILDVTGASPGYIRQLGGRPVGSSWLLGGYPGSLDAALVAVRGDDPALLDRAWVLDAPDSPRRIGGLLEALGKDPRRDYEVVATFTHHLGYTVDVLRPTSARR